LPEQIITKRQEPSQLGKFSPIGEGVEEQLLPPKPTAVVEVPQTLQGVEIPKNPDVKQWDG
jgi:hypothetical protein